MTGEPYTVDHALEELFVERELLEDMIESLERRKNLVLEGPPGVGKTFVTRRLAYLVIGRADPSRLAMVQFHQSYAYEDFIQGWRPRETGGFTLKNGVFFEFCRRAAADPTSRYVFVIDEINRGNLSKIFGELMLLMEADKRGPQHAIPLTYSQDASATFYIPENVHLIGTLNTADRSLALVDYALRRRFAFFPLKAAFGQAQFRAFLATKGVSDTLIRHIESRLLALNQYIRDDRKHLGPGFEIGHSYFCPQPSDEPDENWYRLVIRTEVAPLLREYWFDAPERAEELIAALLE